MRGHGVLRRHSVLRNLLASTPIGLEHRRCFAAFSHQDPLIIVGGGPSGLFLSILLSRYNVPHRLIERQSTESRFRHPQAHFLNTRTMELLRYHLPAHIYARIQDAMPPVHHWKYFRFTHSMSAEPLARVLHAVDRPLQADRDANGVLLTDPSIATEHNESFHRDLSPCTVGHLAQHTFCRILYDWAVAQEPAILQYGTAVESAAYEPRTRRRQVVCDNGSVYTTRLLVAADGAQSPRRAACGIPWKGRHGMQHLMNIHVTLERSEAERLHGNGNHAMLYSIFNEHVVAMVVCHSLGDYIVQIPFFPPYQTVEDDFSSAKIDIILQSIFGNSVRHWTVQSAKPWVMSSMIAQQYFSEGIALVGDAAHVFPPAGGFGMNTGLQDVHNLAWKLACLHYADDETMLSGILQSYQDERQRVAQQNAAVSVRNYQRLLQVTASCYLNEKHPNLLVSVLDKSPLPLQGKQTLFRSLFHAALLPLAWLGTAPSSVYSTHIRSNLQTILRKGAGLPLLFPKHELGFQYGAKSAGGEQQLRWQDDTLPIVPKLQVGRLFPHTEVRVSDTEAASKYPHVRFLRPGVMSTSNLPAQMARSLQPHFVLVAIGDVYISELEELRKRSAKLGFFLECVWLNPPAENLPVKSLILREEIDQHQNAAFSFQSMAPCVVLVRPDSHISAICPSLSSESMDSLLRQAVASFCHPLERGKEDADSSNRP